MTTEIWLLLDSRGMGGIESHVAELAIGLAATGERPRVIFLCDHGPHPLRGRLDTAGIQWEALDGRFGSLLRRLKAGRPALLHTHGYKANLVGRVAARLSGIPAVASYHAGERPGGALAIYDLADRWTSWLGGRIAVSKPILDRLPFGGELVANFVALPPGEPETSPDVVAFVGRLSHEKGPDLFCRLAEQAPGPSYRAYGDGPMRPAPNNPEMNSPSVQFCGAVAGMDDSWREIGLLAITSRAEGLPLAALEAMAHGVPVAAFAVGGLPELIENGVNGFLVPPGDVMALAQAVVGWHRLDRPGRLALSAAARATIARDYGQGAGVERIRRIYARRSSALPMRDEAVPATTE